MADVAGAGGAQPQHKAHSPFLTIWETTVHVVVGTAMFVVIYAPAIGLHAIIHGVAWGESYAIIIDVVSAAKYALIFAVPSTTWDRSFR